MYNQGKQKLLAFVWFFAIVLNNGIVLATVAAMPKQCGPITYAELGEKIISSYGIVAQEEDKEEDDKPKLDIVPLPDQEKRKIAYRMLEESNESFAQPLDAYQQSLYDATRLVIDDLELFGPQGQSIFSHLAMTSTVFGEAELAHMIVTPTTNIAVLHNRQALIKELVENEQLLRELEAVLQRLKQSESAFYSFWLEDNKATQDLIAGLYPSADKGGFLTQHVFGKFNKSPLILESYIRLGNLGTAYQCVGDYALLGLELYIYKTLFNKLGIKLPFPDTVADNIKYGLSIMWPGTYVKEFIRLNKKAPALVNLFGRAIELQAPGVNEGHDSIRSLYKGAQIGAGTMMTGLLAFKAYTIKNALKIAALTKDTANLLQSRLIGAATFVNSVKQVQKFAQKHPVLKKGLGSYGSIKSLLNGSLVKSSEFKELVGALQTDTFKGKASFFSYTGRVLATYKLMQTHKDELAAAGKVLRELDAYVSLAKLYKKYAHERVGYCFVEYVEGDKPYLKLDGFWNPQVDPQKVVTNTTEFGAPDGMRAMILTGSNTGGKSTLLKAMALDVLMAQTVGIAPAQRMVMTPFAYFGSSMNIVDNTAQGKSLYQAEVDRAAGLINAARETQERGGKIFIVMDELFRGTSPEKADKETYDCAKHIYNLDNSLFILATHYFNYPTRLEAETNGMCRNYKVDAYIDNEGNIVRTFKLEPGISMNNIANNILDAALKENKLSAQA